ncbi:MAG TPA: hypothetical protein VGL91_02315 [Acidobacteriota bacterium]|jgi:hypothetical protein
MKGMRKFLFMMALVTLVVALDTATSWAQAFVYSQTGPYNSPALNPFQANKTRTVLGTGNVDDGSKVFPAGTVSEPGSMLLYLVDLGVKGAPLPGQPGFPGPRPVNFLSVTNVHNTAAVTVHVRYLAATTCADVLDFLIILTPNDVFQFNPFDFNIPRPDGTLTGINTSQALTNASFPGSANYPADGRFVIFISASGAFETQPAALQPPFPDAAGRHVANILFPNSIYTANNDIGGSAPLTGWNGTGGDGTNNPNTGGLGGQRSAGRVLTILTAKHISFNYLIGSQTQAVLVTTGAGTGERRSFGVNAWARPAVVFGHAATFSGTVGTSDGANLATITGVGFDKDGDGPQSDFRVILAGQEDINNVANETSSTISNDNFLRSEIQNGTYSPVLLITPNTGALGTTIQVRLRWRVRGGALAWDRIFAFDDAEVTGAAPVKQAVQMLSVEDDYSGDKNAPANANDRAPSFWPAATLVFPLIFNNNEILLSAPPTTIDISPPPPVLPGNLLSVICLDIIQTDSAFNKTGPDFGDFSVADLFVFAPAAKAFLTDVPDDPVQGGQDLSAGWIRFARQEQRLIDSAAIAAEFPNFVVGTCAPGTVPCITAADRTNLNPRQGSYLLIGRYQIQFRELGAAYWMHGVSDEGLSISSNPAP